MTQFPAITGKQLVRLLKCDGWEEGRHSTHGRTLTKRFGNRVHVTFVPEKSKPLPIGTLMAILGAKQTALGKKGLQMLIDRHGS